MNKALHALVYVILLVAAAALFFQLKLNGKWEMLKERDKLYADYFIKLAGTIEKADAAKGASVSVKIDDDRIEAKDNDDPSMKELLEDYKSEYETANLETIKWDDNARLQLRAYYLADEEGNPKQDMVDGGFVNKGPGTADDLLSGLVERAKAQQQRLNQTRAELAKLRGVLENLAKDYNELPPKLREQMKEVEKKKEEIAKIEEEKAAVDEQLAKVKSELEDQKSDVKRLNEELQAAKDETDSVKEQLEKSDKLVDQLKKLIQRAPTSQTATTAPVSGGAASVAAVTHGDKGKLVAVDNKLMFCVIEFTEDAMKELLGPELQGALPQLQMFIKRDGFEGPAKSIVGRVRLRQNVPGKNLVIADILSDWKQTEAKKGDVVFPSEK